LLFIEKVMIEEIRDLLQNFIAPQLEGIKGDIRTLDAKFEAMIGALDAKIDTKIGALDTKIDTKIGA
jgi:hypothetical protein